MKKHYFKLRLTIFILILAGSISNLWSMGGPGGGGGGDCFQFNTQGTIISCTNCTISDGTAGGDIADPADPSLVVTADGCGPVTLIVEYSFDWNQGSANNWIHGVSFNAGPLWTAFQEIPPPDWIYMPSGVTGCCSGSNYGPGYYYDGSDATSAPTEFTANFNCGMGIFCTATFVNPSGCDAVCNGDETLVNNSTGSDCCDGLVFADYFTLSPTGGYPLSSGANDGDPGNNWGVECGINSGGANTGACPTFQFELTYCPSNATPSNFTEYITFTTSADGESGCWCQDDDCDYANGFDVTIQNACGPDAIFDPIPDDYCNATDISLNNVSSGYDGGFVPDPGAEWTDGVVSGGPLNVTFSYCDNISNTQLTHIVGENNCYDGPNTETFDVWTPEIVSVNASPLEACGAFVPTLIADVEIFGTNNTWNGAGTVEWYDCNNPPTCGSPITDFTVTPQPCASTSRTFYSYFNTGCAACDVAGPSITVTAHPNYTEDVVLNPAGCGTATVNILGNDGTTVCQSFTASCPNNGDVQSIPYNFNITGTPCDVSFSGTVDCACTMCTATAGTLTPASQEACLPANPTTISGLGLTTITTNGDEETSSGYSYTFLLTDANNVILDANANSDNLTIPATVGTYNVCGLSYETGQGLGTLVGASTDGVNAAILQDGDGDDYGSPNACMSLTTTCVTIIVNDIPTASPPDDNVCIDQTVMIDGTPSGGSGTYTAHSWTITGGTGSATLTNATSQTVTVDATGGIAGTVDLEYTVTDDNGCMGTGMATVTVNALPIVGLNDPADECINGTDMSFTGTPTNNNGSFSSTAPAGFTDNGNGTADLDVSTAGAGTYDVTYTYTDPATTCVNSFTVSVTIDPLPNINDPGITVCQSDATSYNLTIHDPAVGSGTVTWYDGDPSLGGTDLSPATAVDLTNVLDLWVQLDNGTCVNAQQISPTINNNPGIGNINVDCNSNVITYDVDGSPASISISGDGPYFINASANGCITEGSVNVLCTSCEINNVTATPVCSSTACTGTPAGDYFLEVTMDITDATTVTINVDGTTFTQAVSNGSNTICLDDASFVDDGGTSIPITVYEGSSAPSALLGQSPAGCTGCIPEASGLIVNEASNGSAGNQDWFELVAVGTMSFSLDGWIIDDGTNSSNYLQFNLNNDPSCSFLSSIPPGATIVVYNGEPGGKDPSIPADDPFDANGDGVYIIPHTNVCIDLVGTTLFTTAVGLSNSGADGAQTIFGGSTFSGISWGGGIPGVPDVPMNTSYQFSCGDYTMGGNFSSSGGTGTPGFGNNGDNSNLIAQLGLGTCYECDITYDENITPTQVTLSSYGPVCDQDTPIALNNPENGVAGTWSGSGVSGNSFDPSTLSGPITLTFTPTNTVCFSGNSTDVVVNVAPAANLSSYGPLCDLDAAITLNNPENGVPGTWSGSGVTGDSFNPSGLSGNITLTFTPDAGQCFLANTTDVTVNVAPAANLSSYGPLCDLDAAITLNNPENGVPGTWSGSGVTGDSFNPSGLSGNITLTFTPDAGQCFLANTTDVTVNVAPAANLSSYGPLCDLDAAITLNNPENGVPGTWSGSGVTGDSFNPSGLSGNITLTFTPDAGQCFLANTTDVTVNVAPAANLSSYGPLCDLDAAITLNNPENGVPGTWSGSGVTGDSFNPSGLSGNITLTFTPDAGECFLVNTVDVTVNAAPPATLSSYGPLCDLDAAITLNNPENSVPGTWSGSGVTGDSFDPSGLSGNITLTFTPDAGECFLVNTVDVTVNAAPPATLSSYGPLCDLDAAITLNNPENSVPGTWSGSGVTGDSFDPSGLSGNITLTFTPDAGECFLVNTVDVTVNAAPPATLSSYGPLCDLDAAITLNNPENSVPGTWSGSGVTGDSFDPSGLSGNITLTFTPDAGECFLVNTVDVTVNAAPPATLSSYGPLCDLDAAITLNNPENSVPGTWSGSGVTGDSFDPSGLSGNITLTFTPDAGECFLVNTVDVTVNAAPPATLSSYGPLCDLDAAITLNNPENSVPGTWSGSGVTGDSFDPSGLSGNITLTFTPDAGECFLVNTVDVTVNAAVDVTNAAPPATLSSYGPLCDLPPATLSSYGLARCALPRCRHYAQQSRK